MFACFTGHTKTCLHQTKPRGTISIQRDLFTIDRDRPIRIAILLELRHIFVNRLWLRNTTATATTIPVSDRQPVASVHRRIRLIVVRRW